MHAREGASAFDRLLRIAVQPRFRKAAAVCFAAVVLLTVVSYAYRRPVMESSITRSVTTALRIDGHAGVTVDVKGRDVSLRGSVADAYSCLRVMLWCQCSTTGPRTLRRERQTRKMLGASGAVGIQASASARRSGTGVP